MDHENFCNRFLQKSLYKIPKNYTAGKESYEIYDQQSLKSFLQEDKSICWHSQQFSGIQEERSCCSISAFAQLWNNQQQYSSTALRKIHCSQYSGSLQSGEKYLPACIQYPLYWRIFSPSASFYGVTSRADASNFGWVGEFSFQVQDGQAEFRSSSAKHSCAVFQPGTFPGRLFIRYIPFLNKSRWVTVEKLVFFGKLSRRRPFVFSFDPFCQGLWGSAK